MRRYWYQFLVSICIAAAMIAPGAAAAHAQRSGDRPNLPDEQTAGTDHFLIHFTYEGRDAVKEGDDDGNGVPDYVDLMAESLEYSWQREVVEMGWAVPPNDEGIGGDDRLDVYLENLMNDNIAGYTQSSDGQYGDNPNTPEIESSAEPSFMSIDNDFAEVDPEEDGEDPEDLMQVTVAHEFNHVLQAGYDGNDDQIWLYEAAATWMEGQVYPDIPDRLFYLHDLTDNPQKCLADEDQWYASWLYMQYLSEQYGPDIVRGIWENSREVDGYQALDEALLPYGTSAIGSGRDFAVANLLRAYADGEIYPTVHQGGKIDGAGTFAPSESMEGLGTTYILLNGSGTVTVEFPGRRALSARVIGIRGSEADIFVFSDDTLVIDLDQYDHTYVLVHGDGLSGDRLCAKADFSVAVDAGQGSPSQAAATWPAGNFSPLSPEISDDDREPPNVHQPFRGSGSSNSGNNGNNGGAQPDSSAQSPEDLRPGFSTIIPDAPRGYFFDYAYIMTEKDFGTSAEFYTPDSEQSANYDYLNDDDNWLSVSESPTDFRSLEDWADEIQYSPTSEPEVIGGVRVLFVDSARGKHSQYLATFIYHGLFIVIDGDGEKRDIRAMAESLIEKDKAGIRPVLPGGTQTGAPEIEPSTDEPSGSSSADGPSDSAILLAIVLCGLGICFAGVVVVATAIVLRLRK